MGKTFVMGDIHGNARGLKQCLERSGFDFKHDRLIQLGDVADGWPESSECVDILLTIENFIGIRGNHCAFVRDWFLTGKKHIVWTEHGGGTTISNYINTGKMMDPFHKMFWDDQVDYFIDEKNRLYIHAGWDYHYGFPAGALLASGYGKEHRECHWNRGLLMKAKDIEGKGAFPALEQFKEIFIGHTKTLDSLPHQYFNLWQMDTGSGWHGKLTIMDVDTKEFWQSDWVTLLHPDSLGRSRMSGNWKLKDRL